MITTRKIDVNWSVTVCAIDGKNASFNLGELKKEMK